MLGAMSFTSEGVMNVQVILYSLTICAGPFAIKAMSGVQMHDPWTRAVKISSIDTSKV
jgi:hypothetical protein